MVDGLSTNELNNLKYAIDNGIVDMQHIERQISMSKRKEYLSAHPYEIWQGNNGYYYTYLPDPKKGRVQRKSKDREKLEEQVSKHELTAKGFANLKCVTKGIINRARRRKLIHYSFEDIKMDNKFIMDQVGHSDILTSETFYHRNRKTVLAKQEMLSKIGEFC